MIRTEKEYRVAVERLRHEREFIEAEEAKLRESGLKPSELQNVLEPMRTFHQELVEEIQLYERLRNGDMEPVVAVWRGGLRYVGALLIYLRIARGITQRDLAAKLGVDESSVSRDEHNEYHGVRVERATKILEALGGLPPAATAEARARAKAAALTPVVKGSYEPAAVRAEDVENAEYASAA